MLFWVWWGEKETGHVSLIILSKNMPFSDCYVTMQPFNRGKLQKNKIAFWEIQTVTASA